MGERFGCERILHRNDVVAGTRARYIEAFERLTSISFDSYAADPDVVL